MKKFRIILAAGVASGALTTMAHAQSTGSLDFEEEIIVTGSVGPRELGGIQLPDTTKARGVITDELIQRQAGGNTVLNVLNMVPGVNFTQSDAYGSSGGNIRIRGFDNNRISLTFDGLPLNDSGNYAIFPNQMLDPELISQVNVNLGATDVDSPTASAAGGTVNYLTRLPSDDIGALLSGSIGDFNYSRMFGLIDTGVFTPWGTKAFISSSFTEYNKFKGPGKLSKFQVNARIYQPIGDNGDFISLAGHYNANRNAFYRNPSIGDIRTLFASTNTIQAQNVTSAERPISLGVLSDAQEDALFGFENDASCTNTTGTGSCSNYYGVRVNPSNTGNARWNSRFTITDQLTFTLDGAYQYVLANGGGYTALAENSAMAKGSNQSRQGVDFNGDGDFADNVGFYTPNTTNTNRWTALASLIYEISPDQRVRVSYTFDRARHRQTGEWGYLDPFGNPLSVFGGRNSRPVLNADGYQLAQRDRLSIALLNQVSGQYLGRFLDGKLNVDVGVRAPFFQRDLETYCYIQTSGSGFATCTTQPVWDGTGTQPTGTIRVVPQNTAGSYPANSLFAPFKAKYKYNKLLPNVGLTYKITPQISIFGSYAMGFSAPRTDNLYRAPLVTVTPETTNSFDLGVRYGTSKIQAQVAGWYIDFKNRIVTSFDEAQGISVDRNVGSVEAYGFDVNLSWKVIDELSLYGFASYNHSEFKDNVRLGGTNAAPIIAPLAGKRVPEQPEWSVGGRAQATVGPVSVGAQWKWVDKRFATDLNDVIVPSYNTVDLDARFSLEQFGAERTYFQLNVTNLFDKFYFGNISTQINHGTVGGLPSANPSFALGAPRTIQGTVTVGF